MTKDFLEEIIETLDSADDDRLFCITHKNVKVSDIKCPLVAVHPDGVFIIAELGKEEKDKASELITRLRLNNSTYIWLASDEQDYFYDDIEGEAVPADDIYVSFLSVYFDVCTGDFDRKHHPMKSAVELARRDEILVPEYVEHEPALTASRMEVVEQTITEYEDGGPEEKEKLFGKRYKTVNGVRYIRKLDTFNREQWYPINTEIDPDEFYKTCLFGGIIGMHRFKEGRGFSGVLYMLTGSMFGVLWLSDILAILCDNYRLKDGSYLGHVEKTKKNMLKLPLGLVCGLGIAALVAVGYKFGMMAVTNIVSQDQVSSMAKEYVDEMTEEQQEQFLEQYGITADEFFSMSTEEMQKYIDENDPSATEDAASVTTEEPEIDDDSSVEESSELDAIESEE